MSEIYFTLLDQRSIISISGKDKYSFLQGIVTNNVNNISEHNSVWAALLTPQGRYLHDFFIIKVNEKLLLECEKNRRQDLISRLNKLKLRAEVNIQLEDYFKVGVAWRKNGEIQFPFANNPQLDNNEIVTKDPRLPVAGLRLYFKTNNFSELCSRMNLQETSLGEYEDHRISLGIPDSSRDMKVEKSYLMENNFKELGGIDFKKGCYIGQEVTARMHHRSLSKKQLIPVSIKGENPPKGSIVTINDSKAGEMMTSYNKKGLVLVLLKILQSSKKQELEWKNSTLTPIKPEWMNKIK